MGVSDGSLFSTYDVSSDTLDYRNYLDEAKTELRKETIAGAIWTTPTKQTEDNIYTCSCCEQIFEDPRDVIPLKPNNTDSICDNCYKIIQECSELGHVPAKYGGKEPKKFGAYDMPNYSSPLWRGEPDRLMNLEVKLPTPLESFKDIITEDTSTSEVLNLMKAKEESDRKIKELEDKLERSYEPKPEIATVISGGSAADSYYDTEYIDRTITSTCAPVHSSGSYRY